MQSFTDILDDLDRDGFGHYIAGFIDGEGSFVITTCGPSSGAANCRLQIKLRDDDAAILYEIQKRTGLGRIYAEPVSGRKRDTSNWHPQVFWKVHSKQDCARAVLLLERFPLRAKKRRDFDIWRLAVREWQTKRCYGHWELMAAFRRQLIATRSYVEPGDAPELSVVELQPHLEGLG